MNSTKWLTLTEFIKYLGREGKCKVDETPKGWFITLIHRDEAGVSHSSCRVGSPDALGVLRSGRARADSVACLGLRCA
jgi:hypothetical protein